MEFYYLYRSGDPGTKGSRGWYAHQPDPSKAIFPTQWREIFRGERKLTEPVLLKIKGGRETDFISGGFNFIFNQKVMECLKSAGFPGWDTFPIRLLDKNGNELPGFHGLVITGRCAKVSYISASDGDRLFLDPSTWDGSDFFMPGPQDFQLCTQRVVDTLEREKFKGIQWKKLPEI